MSTEVATIPVTALTVTQRAVVALGITEEKKAELRELAARTVSITVITNTDGYKQVHAARMALKNERIELEKDGKAAREDATVFSKKVIELEKEAVGIISPEEKRLQELQDSYDAAIEAEKQAKVDAEIARVAAIDARIETIRNWPTAYTGKPSSLVEQQVRVATEYQIDEFFEEKADTARAVLEASRAALVGILAERQAHEAEQAKIAADRADLARLRAEQEKREAAEREERARERAEEEKKLAAERARIQEEERVAKVARDAEAKRQADEARARQADLDRIEREKQAEWDRREAEQRAAREAEETRLAAERAEFERQQEEFRKAQEPEVIVPQTERPTDDQILGTLCATYSADRATVMEWILSMDFSRLSIAA